MSRQLTDAKYRAIVVRKKKTQNPQYVPGLSAPYWLYLEETYETHYGPYARLGTAKAMITKESGAATHLGAYPDFVSGRVEEGVTTWTEVDLSE